MIFQETARQGQGLLSLLCAGAAAGVMYDVIAPLRRRAPGMAAPLLDIIWCLLAAALGVFALALSGEGQARLYALPGFLCGTGVYRLATRLPLRGLRRLMRRRKDE